LKNYKSWLTRAVRMMPQSAGDTVWCFITTRLVLYHYSTQEGNISTYKRKPFTNADIFLLFSFVCLFFCHLLPLPYNTVIQLLSLSMTGGISTAYCKSRWPVIYQKKTTTKS